MRCGSVELACPTAWLFHCWRLRMQIDLIDASLLYSYIDSMTFKLSEFTVEQIKQAIAIKEKIEKLENELNTILGGISTDNPIVEWHKSVKAEKNSKKAVEAAAPKRKRVMSPEGRAKIAAAATARWAKLRAKKNA